MDGPLPHRRAPRERDDVQLRRGAGRGLSAVAEAEHPLIRAFFDRDVDGMAAALAEDAVFHSPAADYHGRDQAVPVLTALTRVVADLAPSAGLAESNRYVAFFSVRIRGRDGDGVLLAVGEAGAPASELTLMIRPLATLLAGVEQMKELLDQ